MFNNNSDFYPTPYSIVSKMLQGVDFKFVNSVLEPSAGKGDIVKEVIKKLEYCHSYHYNRSAVWDIDTIEIDENLQHILKGKGYRTVHNDFLTYNSFKRYDLIVMNPPFSTGDKHLLKALEMQDKGGQIVCLLNAETLRNPYSNIRKDLVRKLEDYNAEIEYIQHAFSSAERKTGVEIAIVKINIPKKDNNSSIILDELKKQEQYNKSQDTYNSTGNLINADFIQGIIEQYNFEIKTGLRLIDEYEALKPYMLTSFKDENSNDPVLSLTLSHEDKDGNCSKGNSYIKQIRMKYWKALFTSEQFMGLFTSNLKEKYMSKINELRDYDFSMYNIYTIKIQLNKEMIQGVEDTILNLFDTFSHKHHWHPETGNNIHYYNGWRTNDAFKIGKKVIIPLNAYNNYGNRYSPTDYKVTDKLSDIEKVFNYLDQGITADNDLKTSLNFAENYGDTKKIQLKYFMVTFYKKGTCHIEFTNLDLLHKFNLFGSKRKSWLPPSYGKEKYEDMTQEEKQVINDFEGEQSYKKVMLKKDYYIVETSKLLMLA